jgi:NitT/TauT family transport system permease protein
MFNAWCTLWVTMLGFAIAVVFGLFLGLLTGWSRSLYAGLYPILVGFNAIPKVAIVPILVIWFGIGTVPAVLTAFLISFFPIVVNVATGLATIEPELRTCCARWAPPSSTSCARSASRARCPTSSAR